MAFVSPSISDRTFLIETPNESDKENHASLKIRDELSGSLINNEKYDSEIGSCCENVCKPTTSFKLPRSQTISGDVPYVPIIIDNLSDPLSSKVCEEKESIVTDSSDISEIGSDNRALNNSRLQIPINATKTEEKHRKKRISELEQLQEGVRTIFIGGGVLTNRRRCEAKPKKHKIRSKKKKKKKEVVVPHQGLIKPSSNNAPITRYHNTRSHYMKPSIRPQHAEVKSPVILEPKIKKTVKPTETIDSSGGRQKRRLDEVDDTQNVVVKRKRVLSQTFAITKNNNPDWHCLNKTVKCQLCKMPAAISLVSHYVNCHPNNEVFPCRVAPIVAEFLRSSTEIPEVKHVMPELKVCYEFKQRCYFCNEIKSLTKLNWIKHATVHTGYYQHKCTNCKRRFAASTPYHACHRGKVKSIVVKETLPQFYGINVFEVK